jgi:hypothetical protein
VRYPKDTHIAGGTLDVDGNVHMLILAISFFIMQLSVCVTIPFVFIGHLGSLPPYGRPSTQ